MMGILADMDAALGRFHPSGARKEFRLSKAAMDAYYAQTEAGEPSCHRGVPVVQNDWDTGWELAAA